jgi:hypothetical protein
MCDVVSESISYLEAFLNKDQKFLLQSSKQGIDDCKAICVFMSMPGGTELFVEISDLLELHLSPEKVSTLKTHKLIESMLVLKQFLLLCVYRDDIEPQVILKTINGLRVIQGKTRLCESYFFNFNLPVIASSQTLNEFGEPRHIKFYRQRFLLGLWGVMKFNECVQWTFHLSIIQNVCIQLFEQTHRQVWELVGLVVRCFIKRELHLNDSRLLIFTHIASILKSLEQGILPDEKEWRVLHNNLCALLVFSNSKNSKIQEIYHQFTLSPSAEKDDLFYKELELELRAIDRSSLKEIKDLLQIELSEVKTSFVDVGVSVFFVDKITQLFDVTEIYGLTTLSEHCKTILNTVERSLSSTVSKVSIVQSIVDLENEITTIDKFKRMSFIRPEGERVSMDALCDYFSRPEDKVIVECLKEYLLNIGNSINKQGSIDIIWLHGQLSTFRAIRACIDILERASLLKTIDKLLEMISFHYHNKTQNRHNQKEDEDIVFELLTLERKFYEALS